MSKHIFVYIIFLLCLNISAKSHNKDTVRSSNLEFVENLGQWNTTILYKANLTGGTVFLEKNCLTFDFLDYPMERDMLDLKHRKMMVFKRPGIWVGYGGLMFFIFLIPLLNILVWPILITSGTLLYIDKLKIKIKETLPKTLPE